MRQSTRKFVFHNPHTSNWFGKPMLYHFLSRNCAVRYKHIWEYFRLHQGIIYVHVDGLSFSGFRTLLFGKGIATVEFILWCIFNGHSIKNIKLIKSLDSLTEDDVLFSFAHGNFGGPYNDKIQRKVAVDQKKLIGICETVKAIKVVHLTHYMFDSDAVSRNLQIYKPDFLVAESDLSVCSTLFKDLYKWYGNPFIVVPYVPQSRFQNKVAFHLRKKMAVAMGTLLYKINDAKFREKFPSGELHPIRRLIYDNRLDLVDIIDCRIMETEEKEFESKNQTFLIKLLNCFKSGQKKYFQFDAVEMYNQYQLFMVPEEATGLPSIGFVEGMACGSVLVSSEKKIYDSLGMIPNVHYILSDGTVDGIRSAIVSALANPDMLMKISCNGLKLVSERFSVENVCRQFFNSIRIS